ncbi:uncharacterized protein [Rutidosis leptorrhynchoides]|uniref:uncharacterized protein n=1 Tax=Rutidosis leptorrhynchoides TaxID=125765 RepID=UPI003A99B414
MVKDTRVHIDRHMLPSQQVATSWIKYLPRKVNVFWHFNLDLLPLCWNLSAKGLEIPTIMCPICSHGIEMQSHIFFTCTIASETWRLIRFWLGCSMPIFTSWLDVQSWLEDLQMSLLISSIRLRSPRSRGNVVSNWNYWLLKPL